MSGQYFEMFIKPKNQDSSTKINEFFDAINDGDLDLSKSYDPKQILLSEWESLLELNDFNKNINNEIIEITFATGTLFNLESLLKFLPTLKAKDIEVEVFNSQTGETYYHKNRKYFEEYKKGKWNWIEEKLEPDFEDEFVVITGEFDDEYCRDDIEGLVEGYDGTLQESVNERTTLIIIGEESDASEVKKASSLGIKMMYEKEFIKLVDVE